MHIKPIHNLALKIAALEFWVVGLLLVASLIWTDLLVLVVLGGAAFWIIRWVAYGRISLRTPADWGIVILAFMAVVGLVITPLPDTSTPQILRLISGIIIYYAIVNWAVSNQRNRILVTALVLSGITLASYALISVEWAALKLQILPIQVYKLFSILVTDSVHPNVMAGTLVILAPIMLSIALFNEWSSMKITGEKIIFVLSTVGFLWVTLILVLTLSRAAWIAYITVVVLLVAMRWKWGWIIMVIVVCITALFIFLAEPAPLLGFALESQTLGSLMERNETWSQAIFIIDVFPLTGVGMGLYTDIAEILYPLALVSTEMAEHAHNLFLQVAVDLGLPGLIAWLSVISVVIFSSWNLYRNGQQERNRWLAGLGAGYFCSTIALAVHGVMDSVVWGMVRSAPIVWVIWGAVMACSQISLVFPKNHLTSRSNLVSNNENSHI